MIKARSPARGTETPMIAMTVSGTEIARRVTPGAGHSVFLYALEKAYAGLGHAESGEELF